MRTAVASRVSLPAAFPFGAKTAPDAIAELAQDRRSRWGQYRGIPHLGAQTDGALGRTLAGATSTNHPFAHGRRRMMSCSIVDDPGSPRVGVSNSESVIETIDHSENARTGTAAPDSESSRAAGARYAGLGWRSWRGAGLRPRRRNSA